MPKALRELEQEFLEYLLTGDSSRIAPYVSEKGKSSIETKLHIYSNAYKMRFRETIETNHEILGLYLGDGFFDVMVDGYVMKYPSHYPSLRDYTLDLPDFLQRTQPFSDHPILAEIARFERLLLDVFDAPDFDSITIDDLRRIPPDEWPEMRLRFHPSVQLFVAEWNSVESWQHLKAGENPDPAQPQPNSHWILWRDSERLSEFRSMTLDETMLMRAVTAGDTFAGMCELLTTWHSDEEATIAFINYVSNWISNGMVIALVTEK